MSSAKQKVQKQLKHSDEEQLSSEEPKTKKGKSKRPQKPQKKDRKKKDSYSSDGEKKGKHQIEEEDDDLDNDDYDDEDSYDSEENESNESFIAPEEVVEEEIMKERKWREEEYRKEKKQKGGDLKERQRMDQLDSEDEEIIKENMGLQIERPQKKRRLKKNTDVGDIKDESMEDATEGIKREEDPNQAQFQPGKKTQMQDYRNLQLQQELDRDAQDIVPQASYAAESHEPERRVYYNSMFKDANQLKEQLKHKQQQLHQQQETRKPNEDEQMQDEGLEEMFDGQEIDDQYATKQDDLIAVNDVPERLQIILGNRFNPDPEELRVEAEWIVERLEQEKDTTFQNPQSVKEKVQNVLNLFRNEKLDIPMIIKYRRFLYANELDESDVQQIFNLDQEFGQFKQKKEQILQFLRKIQQFDNYSNMYEPELEQMKNQYELEFFSPLITFMKSYYNEELNSLQDDEQKKKNPIKFDKIQNIRKHRLDEFAKFFALPPALFCENLQHRKLVNKPPENKDIIPYHLAGEYKCEAFPEEIKIFNAVCEFYAIQLGAQPYIRQLMKNHFYRDAHITTQPTEKGNKEIDVFHPSYRVKRIDRKPLKDFHHRYRDLKVVGDSQDLFLDILQNERNGLITVNIQIDKEVIERFYAEQGQLFMQNYDNPQDQWNIMRKEIVRRMYEHVLYPEMIKEAKIELKEAAENFIIKQAQEKYREMLMTGPFECLDQYQQQKLDENFNEKGKKRRFEDEIVKDRPRISVMGVILQQIDMNNHMVTVAVVDKYGELLAHKDLMHIMPPRKARQVAEMDEEKRKKIQLTEREEQKVHEEDKRKVAELLMKYQVDLVVVGANKLDARKVKEVFTEIAVCVKSGQFDGENEEDNQQKKSKGKSQISDVKKETFVIWGSLEVPKLFASGHKSMKLLKNCNQNLKQAVSLARFEQDPMCEILNLWSSVPSENQTLSLNLHPLQKLINQAKFAQALEEVNITCVNKVGIDLNVLIDHDHLQCVLQFLSGLGPRKAKRLLKQLNGKKSICRKELLSENLLPKTCFMSAIAFIKIRVPPEERMNQPQDYLDLTRIHSESYITARKIACDALYPDTSDKIQENEKLLAPKEVLKNPDLLKNLDLKQMKIELKQGGQQNMISIVDIIIEEFKYPFKDPRDYRNIMKKQNEDQLLYWLIDESERTFKRGIIVTATVVKVLQSKILCKLDNGLDGIIMKEDIGSNETEKLEDFVNHVITGRIDKINKEENKDGKYEGKFSVTLKCKRQDLERHDHFVDKEIKDKIPKEDLINLNFQIEKRQSAQSRYVQRRINHPKFKNTTSNKAMQELQDKEIGEFLFRPSSKGTDNINLTWKFYTNNIVHIDIVEHDKPPGASIGTKLQINEEEFENLQEIYERYILPCNRSLREVISNAKFVACADETQFANILKAEKSADPSKIPYKFTILSDYPQHIVLGYIARNEKIDKEFIKVKPRGFYFHEKYHKPFQNLINWYKENFRTREYQKMKMKYDKRPPIVKQQIPNIAEQRKSPRPQAQMDWQPAKGGDSVHSMNDERRDSNTPYQVKTENYGGRTQEVYGGSSRTGALTGAQFSEYNQNIQSNMTESFGRGKSQPQCYNCQEFGHMSKECPNQKKQSSYGRGGVSRGQIESRRKQDSEGGGWNQAQEEKKNESGPGWGGQGNNSPGEQRWDNQESDGFGGGQRSFQPENQLSQGGGWGQKTPQRNENFGGGNDWGNDVKEGSPAQSQRSHQESYGRGGGRGRGRGSGQGGRACYKCDKEGHMARDCPNTTDERPNRGRGGGGGGNNTCFKCHQSGHFARECPNAQDQTNDDNRGRFRGRGGGVQGAGRTCYKCQREGHFAKECPNDPVERERPAKRPRRDDGGGSQRWENEQQSFGGNNDQDNGAWGGGGGNPSTWDGAAVQQRSNEEGQSSGWGN